MNIQRHYFRLCACKKNHNILYSCTQLGACKWWIYRCKTRSIVYVARYLYRLNRAKLQLLAFYIDNCEQIHNWSGFTSIVDKHERAIIKMYNFFNIKSKKNIYYCYYLIIISCFFLPTFSLLFRESVYLPTFIRYSLQINQ